tara:strand:+ start:4697 stop:5431 length:735 start_codon:yes stop_codon:yes gene_type:complete
METNVSLGDIWETLYPVKCGESAKQKNGLTYLPWNEAWRLLMNHYPTAHYEFGEIEIHSDGSQTIHCSVAIEGHARHMWLPVMNYKNQAIANPSARDVSDTKMRCLVKTIAMFGLGFHIFQGQVQPEDTWNDTETNEPEAKPKAKPQEKKPAAKKPDPKPVAEESDEDEFYLNFDGDGANGWVDMMISTVEGMVETKKGLRSMWEANKKAVDHIQSKFPESYERLAAAMKAKQDEFNNKEKSND